MIVVKNDTFAKIFILPYSQIMPSIKDKRAIYWQSLEATLQNRLLAQTQRYA